MILLTSALIYLPYLESLIFCSIVNPLYWRIFQTFDNLLTFFSSSTVFFFQYSSLYSVQLWYPVLTSFFQLFCSLVIHLIVYCVYLHILLIIFLNSLSRMLSISFPCYGVCNIWSSVAMGFSHFLCFTIGIYTFGINHCLDF